MLVNEGTSLKSVDPLRLSIGTADNIYPAAELTLWLSIP